ncbi:MAG: ATP-binding cassette domain-containing protein, partial [Burkholderiales bacterium]|nr:ATP-binding cassette domain-containing protein [Burkholderiales bacterium]
MHFSYPDCPLFKDWSADIPAGVTLVRGGDGRGKSSLLQILAGELPAASGQIQLQGVDASVHAEQYRRQVYWMNPRNEEYEQVIVSDYFASLKTRFQHFDAAKLDAAVQGLALVPHLHKHLYMLSTGSKRKVWLAAAFAAGATLNLLDDPFAGLDKASIQFVIAQLNQMGDDPYRVWVLADYQAAVGLQL